MMWGQPFRAAAAFPGGDLRLEEERPVVESRAEARLQPRRAGPTGT
jgi:hypothetical protein